MQENPIDEKIQQRIDKFRLDLHLDVPKIVRKHIIFGDCWAFDNDRYFDLKVQVADQFYIHPSEVLVVGSARMGFSVAPTKRYQPFHNSSDIDVAIVSPSLFDKVWQQALECKESSGYFWDVEESVKFKDYLFRGWIRPDKLPSADSFPLRREWKEFFRGLTRSGLYGPYKLAAGLYKSWYHIERYQSTCVKQCQQDIQAKRLI
ncbi:MAG: hypothetical protein JO125_01220 [Chloroflexi bacterium]|nr:hypothetical protein [Chloroflexota bacterium]